MAMKHMAVEQEQHAEGHVAPGVAEGQATGPKYPYGTELHLDHETLGKLGIKDLPAAGSPMHVQAKGHVSRASEEKQTDGSVRRSMSVQLTHADLTPPPKDRAKALYGEEK